MQPGLHAYSVPLFRLRVAHIVSATESSASTRYGDTILISYALVSSQPDRVHLQVSLQTYQSPAVFRRVHAFAVPLLHLLIPPAKETPSSHAPSHAAEKPWQAWHHSLPFSSASVSSDVSSSHCIPRASAIRPNACKPGSPFSVVLSTSRRRS